MKINPIIIDHLTFRTLTANELNEINNYSKIIANKFTKTLNLLDLSTKQKKRLHKILTTTYQMQMKPNEHNFTGYVENLKWLASLSMDNYLNGTKELINKAGDDLWQVH